MTSDDVSVIWKSAFPLQWAQRGETYDWNRARKGDVEQGRKQNLCHERGHKSAQNTSVRAEQTLK